MSKELAPYEGWSWGRRASDSSLTETDSPLQEDLWQEVQTALGRSPTTELDQQRPTRVGVEAAAEEQKNEKEKQKVEPQQA